jgi:Glycosyltransferase family 87
MKKSIQSLDIFFTGALRLWIIITSFVSVSCLALYAFMGSKGLSLLIQEGSYSITEQTFACVIITWVACGVVFIVLKNIRLRSEYGAAIVCSLLLLLLYINILRERIKYGSDVGDYIQAAFDLQGGKPFHGSYIYPPLLATLCQPFLQLGTKGLAATFWFANILSLILFFWLLIAVLIRYGFGRNLSLWLVFIFMVVNVPILRTLGYVQVNLHVMNLILLTILLFPHHYIFSALALATAVHLKASPLILALPFFWTGGKKWVMSFLVGLIGLSSLTFVFYGWTPFMAFFNNIGNIYSVNGISFHENSVDSFVRATSMIFGVDSLWTVMIFKVPILILIFVAALYNMRYTTFSKTKGPGQDILNIIPSLLVLMVIASPLVWEHHSVFLAIPFLLITKKLDTPYAWMWYCFAYLLEFLMPTFDFFPWSYGRLISPIILIFLSFTVSQEHDSEMFLYIRDRLDSFHKDLTINDASSLAT